MKRLWRSSVLDALQRTAARKQSAVVTRQQLIDDELPTIIAETQTKGLTPNFTLSYELQNLRDAGLIKFLGKGRYQLLKPIVDVEKFDGDDHELDEAINDGRLRIGRIETGNDLTLQKRRRGQQRLRRLALGYYGCQCALCDMKEEAFLITSHIVPWAESEDGRGDLSNVIILCRPHDSLFEFGRWSLNNELGILRRFEKQSPWIVDALLPKWIAFRAPKLHSPSDYYLETHRKRNKLG